jgi:hypothetical protein
MSRTVPILLLLLGMPFVCEGQSLGSVAKKEKKRREENKQQGVAVREIREDEVKSAEDEKPAERAPESDGADGVVSEGEPPVPERIDVNLGAEGSKPSAGEQADRSAKEAEWRARFQDARARLSAARERVNVLDGLYLGQESANELQRLNRDAKAELEAAEKSLKDLQEEARRAGVPPGWLR